MRGAISPPQMSLHYQSVLDKVSSHGVSGSHDSLDETAAVATGFFDLANADVVRYSVVRAAEDDNELELTVAQDQRQHDSCGGIVWESAFCLAEFIQRNGGGSVRGKNVLELGAGAGLVGMVCKKLGAKKVVLSDHPNAIALLRKNVQRNFHSNQEPGMDTDTTDDISVLPLDWRDEQHLAAVLKNGPYDVVVATDVVFSTDLVRAFPNHHVPPLRLPILVLRRDVLPLPITTTVRLDYGRLFTHTNPGYTRYERLTLFLSQLGRAVAKMRGGGGDAAHRGGFGLPPGTVRGCFRVVQAAKRGVLFRVSAGPH